MMEWALKYRGMGFSVIPLRPKSKIPVIKWEEYQSRLPSDEEITAWFRDQPNLNIGLVTGEVSGFVVVDLDGPDGLATGKRLGLTSPVCVHTANGSHLYYRWAAALRNSVRKLPGLDIRGDGGYVAAPPSLHPNGKYYRWASSPLARHLLPDLPQSFLNALKQDESSSNGGKNEKGRLDVAQLIANMRQGNIDETLFRACSRLRADGYSVQDARLFLGPHAERAGATPGHLDDKIANVWSRYSPNEKATAAVTRVGKAEGLTEFLQDKQEVEWICHPIIAKKSIGFVAGLPETLKTWLLIDLAVAMVANSPWLGLFPIARGRVLFVDQERFKGETQRRFAAVIAEKGYPAAATDGLFVKCGTDIKLNDDRSFELFRAELHEIKPDIVMVDSFATFHSAQENDRMAVQGVMNRIKQLRDEIGCSFVFINHESKMVFQDVDANEKPSAFRMMGSVGIVAAAEFVLTVRKMADGSSIVHHTKSSLAASSKSFFVSVVDTERGIAVKGTA